MNSSLIEQALAPLVGLPLRCIGRAADLVWFHFGEMRETASPLGAVREVGEWALHVQCPWRLRRSALVLVGRRDCFQQADSDEPYDRDARGESSFDLRVRALNREIAAKPPRIVERTVDEVGGFALRFDGDLFLEVFPDESSQWESEHWRLFRPGIVERHFVFPEPTCQS